MNKPLDEPMYPRRSHWERRRDVMNVLEQHPEYSDRRIADIAVVCRELVRQVRQAMIRKSQIQSHHALRRVGADGKTYELPRPKVGAGT